MTAGADNTLKFWEVETGDMRRVERVEQPIRAVALNPDGRGVAVALAKDVIQVWHSRNSVLRATCRLSGENGAGLIFSPDGKWLASGSKDGSVHLWDASTGREKRTFPGHEKSVCFVAFTPDGKQLISASTDGRIIVRDSVTGEKPETLTLPLPIETAALAGDGRHLAAGNIDGTVYLLRLAAAPR